MPHRRRRFIGLAVISAWSGIQRRGFKTLTVAGFAALSLGLPSVAQANTTLTPDSYYSFGTTTVGQPVSMAFTAHSDGSSFIQVQLGDGSHFAETDTCGSSTTCTIYITEPADTVGGFNDYLNVWAGSTSSTNLGDHVNFDSTVILGPVGVNSTSLSQSDFYPLVQDGYRDAATYSFDLNEPASGSVQVLNRKGSVVKSFAFTDRQSLTVTWRGRTDKGGEVAPGYYRIRVKAHAGGTSVTSGGRIVQVKTGWRATKHSIHRSGPNTSSRSAHSCYFEPYQGTLTLDSWGGSCTAHWFISVPSNAYSVSYGVSAHRDSNLDVYGPVSKSGIRTSGGVSFTATAGEWAAFDVDGVHVTYYTKVRI